MPHDAMQHLGPERLRRLLEVGRGLVSELRAEQVLEEVLVVARELTGARYAALGVLDDDRRRLARFITSGLDAEAQQKIGDLPRGRGILGVLIQDPRPLRLDAITPDARAFGFPPGHPPMGSFLGVPIRVRGEAWGNLYLTEKAGGGDFDDADEASAVVLADWAAIAIENARLYETLERRRSELERAVKGFEATSAIATAVGAETDLDRVLGLVVTRGQSLAGARSVLVLLEEGDQLVVASAAGDITGEVRPRPVVGTRVGEALNTRRRLRIDDVAADPLFDSAAYGVPDATSALLVPLTFRDRALGVLVAFDPLQGAGFDDDHVQVLSAFAASAATAVATARSVESRRLRAALDSAEAERGRWARELHDETLQALGGLRVLLSSAVRSGSPARLSAAAQDAVDHVTGEIANLRAIIAELRPASLDALGLRPALQTLAERMAAREGIDVSFDVDVGGDARLPPELETGIYRVAQEALTNAAKHAKAERVSVHLYREQGALLLTVADDGIGFDQEADVPGFGLLGIRERIELVGGRLAIASTPGGTVLEARFPLTGLR